MFREMRRFRQQLSHEESEEILRRAASGVLALLGDEDYPYAVPLSHVYADGKLYFHGARSGHKLDAARAHPKASFCVVDQDQVVAEEYTTYFRSVIIFGRARIIDDVAEKHKIAELLVEKYSPNQGEDIHKMFEKRIAWMGAFEIDIDHISGKEAIEFADPEFSFDSIKG